MTAYAALLRAVNVGGTGLLAMSDLVALCTRAGLEGARTYIQSGNVVFRSKKGERAVKSTLEAALAKQLGKPVAVMVRTAAELERVVADNPFPSAPPNRVIVLFLDAPGNALEGVRGQNKEVIEARGRELYIHYPDGQGTSKLKLRASDRGTGRNLNTVIKLAQMTREALG
jgi:uncharacterized protein (DUF1697 family)